MPLIALSYSEFEDDPRHWRIESTDFRSINLLVGKNATGKTRVLNVVRSLAKIISGELKTPFQSGKFVAEVELSGKRFCYSIDSKQNKIVSETLSVDGAIRLKRDARGSGTAYFASENRDIPFQIDPGAIAIQNKNDKLQHPFIHELAEWASGVELYRFGSDFGKSTLIRDPMVDASGSGERLPKIDVDDVVRSYIDAYQRYGSEFDAAVIRDMAKLGYDLKEVGAEPLTNLGPGLPTTLLGLVTVESELDDLRNPQVHMSQGMFRALALIIHLNLATFSRGKNLLLIDDIGEGLDYQRATAIIDLIIATAETNGMQIVMTSNDSS
ncbi:MAG TPA: AAA family ATPase [Rhodocyclaceae bacterium]|nr:AAA family ATPase [Rhodocyclaceae bacterium]